MDLVEISQIGFSGDMKPIYETLVVEVVPDSDGVYDGEPVQPKYSTGDGEGDGEVSGQCPSTTTAGVTVPEIVTVTVTQKQSICLICAKLLDFTPPQKYNPSFSGSVASTSEQLLNILLYVFKISPSIYEGQGIDPRSLPTQVYCTACQLKIFESLKILNDIEIMESNLDKIKIEIRNKLMNSYCSQNQSQDCKGQDGAFISVGEGHEDSHSTVLQLRKTFAQCWSWCNVDCSNSIPVSSSVDVNKLSSSSFSSSSVQRRKRTNFSIQRAEDETEARSRPQRQVKKPRKYEDSDVEIIQHDNSVENNIELELEQTEVDPLDSPGFQADDDNDGSDYDPGCDPDFEDPSNDPIEAIEPRKRRKKLTGTIMQIRKAHRGFDLPFKCSVCSKGYRREISLKLHEKYHKGLLDFACSKCPRKFTSDHSLRRHKFQIHTVKSKKNESNEAPQQAKRIPRSIRKYSKSTTTTSVTSRTKKYCARILSPHHFTCKFCNREFFKKDFVQPNGIFLFACDIFGCGQIYQNFLIFGRHHERTCLARVLPIRFTCEICEKDFSSAKTLEQHNVSFHTKNYEFCCEKCGLGLVSKGSYKRHMQQHSEEKKFKCTFCPTAYKRKDYLVTHLKRHTNVIDLPYTCDKCGKGFTDSQKLNRHRLVHNEGAEFPCPICSKLFKNKNYVNSHIWSTHKGLRKNKKGKNSNASVGSKIQ